MSQPHCADCQKPPSEEELLQMLSELLEDYKTKPGGLIPALQLAQKMFGYLPKPAIKLIATKLDKPYSEVTGVISFYSFFSTTPRGKYIVRVCLGTACYVRGGKEVLSSLQKELSIGVGQSTADGLFSIDVGRCFGACGLAPVLMVNDDVHQRVKADKINQILQFYKEQETAVVKEEIA